MGKVLNLFETVSSHVKWGEQYYPSHRHHRHREDKVGPCVTFHMARVLSNCWGLFLPFCKQGSTVFVCLFVLVQDGRQLGSWHRILGKHILKFAMGHKSLDTTSELQMSVMRPPQVFPQESLFLKKI